MRHVGLFLGKWGVRRLAEALRARDPCRCARGGRTRLEPLDVPSMAQGAPRLVTPQITGEQLQP